MDSILAIDFGLHESTLDFRGHKRSKQDRGRNGAPNRARQRHDGCDMLMIPITTIVSGLKLSFILCREVPVLFQKCSVRKPVGIIFPSSITWNLSKSSIGFSYWKTQRPKHHY
uniref:Uncharacterized protein n=1 Tax=Lactuca sativa TaxID=4236 RepID=A0A9R1WDW9_LACSA|nr:hypothetical protein LSAT_V11C200084070 [Lactuca sativa]